MLLLPPIFNGLVGLTVIGIIAFSLFVFPAVFAEPPATWKIIIPEGASQNQLSVKIYPEEMPVSKGDSIQWVNKDSVAHSIVSGMEKFPDYYGYFFKTGLIKPGQLASIKLTSSESYAFYYLCEIHPWLTGKLFYQEAIEAQGETENPIIVGKSSYAKEEKIRVSGQVHKDFWGTNYEILVFDEQKNLIDVVYGKLDEESKYSDVIDTTESWNSSGKYQLKVVYGLPSKVSETTFDYSAKSADTKIPAWVKNIGEYWCADKTSDTEFVNAIQYLVDKKIIEVNHSNVDSKDAKGIPSWIKTNTCWWSKNQISDIDFLSGIEFLINKGTIQI